MSETALADSLNREIARLQSELSKTIGERDRHRDEAQRRKKQLQTLAEERDQIKGQVDALSAERDQFKQRAEAQPGELQQELDRLRGDLATRDHRDAFRDLLADESLGLDRRIGVDKLMTLLGHKAEGEPDREAIKQSLLAQKEGDLAFLFSGPAGGQADPQGSQAGIQLQAAGPGLGAGRGITTHSPTTEESRLRSYHAERGRTTPGRI